MPMTVYIRDRRLKASLENPAVLKKKYGEPMAKKIAARLQALTSAETLADFWPAKSGPERCHELIGDMSGIFSMDVKQPYRLLFKDASPATEETQTHEGKEKWLRITAVEILGIEDTHG